MAYVAWYFASARPYHIHQSYAVVYHKNGAPFRLLAASPILPLRNHWYGRSPPSIDYHIYIHSTTHYYVYHLL